MLFRQIGFGVLTAHGLFLAVSETYQEQSLMLTADKWMDSEVHHPGNQHCTNNYD